MVLKLFGHPDSTCTKRAAVVLHEKNIPFEFHQIDFSKQEHKSPGFLEKQPFGQVPYLVRPASLDFLNMVINPLLG